MDYSNLLRDPRWQKKRNNILFRDNYTCTACQAIDRELHVHHLYYKKFLLPWEYPDDALKTLCFLCHEKVEFLKWLSRQGYNSLFGDFFNETPLIIQLIRKTLWAKHHVDEARQYMSLTRELVTL